MLHRAIVGSRSNNQHVLAIPKLAGLVHNPDKDNMCLMETDGGNSGLPLARTTGVDHTLVERLDAIARSKENTRLLSSEAILLLSLEGLLLAGARSGSRGQNAM